MTTVKSVIAELQKLSPAATVNFVLITDEVIQKHAAKRKLDVSCKLLAEVHKYLEDNYNSHSGNIFQQIDIALDIALIQEGFMKKSLH